MPSLTHDIGLNEIAVSTAGTIVGAMRNTDAVAALLPEKRWATPVTGLGEFHRRGPHSFKGYRQWHIPITAMRDSDLNDAGKTPGSGTTPDDSGNPPTG